jgi:DNA-binding HxlR family transcriptional regulator
MYYPLPRPDLYADRNEEAHMRSYGQFCPIAKAAELFCERWTALILRDLVAGATRFGQLKRGVPQASPTLLSRRLKELEREGVIERRRAEGGRGFTYHLTPAGREFAPLIHALGVWGQRWTRRELAKHEINLTLFLWAVELSVKPEVFEARRCVVQMTFTDLPQATRNWWFVNEGGRAELCFEEPGFEVNLYLEGTLPDMILVYRGDLSLAQALGHGRLKAHGMVWARRLLSRWFRPSALAHVKSNTANLRAA